MDSIIDIQKMYSAVLNAKDLLKPGDRFRTHRCGGSKPTFTFDQWYNDLIVTKSGVVDIAAISIDRLNGCQIDLSTPIRISIEEAMGIAEKWKQEEKRLQESKLCDIKEVPF